MTPRQKQHHLFPTYNETKKIIALNGIHTVLDYRNYYSTGSVKIPYHPERIYADVWLGWDIFLRKHKTPMVSYHTAKILVREENIQTILEYENWYKECDMRLPSAPATIYKDDWTGWNDFLQGKPKFADYKEAAALVLHAGIKSSAEYRKWYRSANPRIPAAPQIKYPEWTSWNDFLGKS